MLGTEHKMSEQSIKTNPPQNLQQKAIKKAKGQRNCFCLRQEEMGELEDMGSGGQLVFFSVLATKTDVSNVQYD